ncbi:hypothetical protein [Jiulongibacter sp. NS-SX5]|uniref:hypothetical protein n=1 Tax=Jiulongibacter sp. NS-SX5 TaxID=3463854 RepID=UPI004058A6AF
MQSYKKLLLLFTLLPVFSQAQNPTIYLSDFEIADKHFELPEDLGEHNLFESIYFFEKEVYEGGFKERKLTIYHKELLKQLKGTEILFNTNFTFKYDLPGFYKNDNLKATYSIDSKAGLKEDTKPNIFFVKDILYTEDGELESLHLHKIGDEKKDDIYFSVKDFIEGSKVKIGSLADLGLIQMEFLRKLEAKHNGKVYHLAFHDGRGTAIPENVETPVTILNRTSTDNYRLKKSKTVSSLLWANSWASGDPSMAFAGILLDIGMRNSYNEQQRKMAEFKEKQRQLLYNYDIASNAYLTRSDFGPSIKWKFEDVKILEDSGKPVLVLNNDKGQKILVLEELEDMYITSQQVEDFQSKIGQEKYLKLYEVYTESGQSLPMIRFALGYENYMAMASEDQGTYEEAYAFGKEWYYFENGKLSKKEWKNFRYGPVKNVSQPTNEEE